ncbi:MAG: ligase-associated DNA damage response endonuclease PdeM [Bdellovibrio sp.]|nr:ligase-associated DNA damage response endonuclease PdeM [Bdellovibrio sp.]
MKLELSNEEIHLLPEKAFYWPKEKILGLSDVHIGKAESLQSFGIPIPSGPHLEDLANLEKLIEKTQAKSVFVLGDWIHQKNSWSPNILKDLDTFFNKHKNLNWTLLIGNHERGSIEYLKKYPFKIIEDAYAKPPFLFTHGHLQARAENLFQIQGHIHPVIRIKEGSTRLRLPCFVLDQNSLTLPSFGSLTGGYEVSHQKNRRFFATAEKTVFEVPY